MKKVPVWVSGKDEGLQVPGRPAPPSGQLEGRREREGRFPQEPRPPILPSSLCGHRSGATRKYPRGSPTSGCPAGCPVDGAQPLFSDPLPRPFLSLQASPVS